MKFVLRQAWRELRNSRSFCFFYSLNLALGLIGFMVVDSVFHDSEVSQVGSLGLVKRPHNVAER